MAAPNNGLIFKLHVTRYHLADGAAVDMPDIHILGSREAFRWLGAALLEYAEANMDNCLDDHWHIRHDDDVVDQELSDQLCLRFDLLAENRAELLDMTGITPGSRKTGKPTGADDPYPEIGPHTVH